MYLHIGQNVVIRQQDIIGIFDLDNTTVSRFTREFLAKAEKTAQIDTVNDELPKSFVVCSDKRKHKNEPTARQTVYVAQMAPRTLYKRTVKTNTMMTETDL